MFEINYSQLMQWNIGETGDIYEYSSSRLFLELIFLFLTSFKKSLLCWNLKRKCQNRDIEIKSEICFTFSKILEFEQKSRDSADSLLIRVVPTSLLLKMRQVLLGLILNFFIFQKIVIFVKFFSSVWLTTQTKNVPKHS